MAITHVEGAFEPEHFSKEFGFSGSTAGQRAPRGAQEDETPASSKIRGKSAVPYDADVATHGSHMGGFEEHGKGTMDFARGGEVHHPHGHEPMHEEEHMGGGRKVHHMHGGHSIHHPDGHVTHHHHDGSEVPAHMARGGHSGTMHPHGHHITHTEHKSDGRVIMHHAHGGHSVMHPHGHMSHHGADGAPAHMAMGGHHDPESEYVHKARGGHQLAGKPQTLPRDMKPAGMRHHSPIETAPRDPGITTTPRNQMSGGEMGYGVEPSAEPDTAGDGQGIPQMRRGGHKR